MKSDRPTRFAIRAEETPRELIEALARADYGHLPELRALSASEVYRDTQRRFPKTMKLLGE